MALFPELNKRQTVDNVRRLFEKELPRLENMAQVSIGSPTISDMPSAPKSGNTNVDKYTNYVWAKETLAKVRNACEFMPEPYRTMLKMRYFNKMTWVEIEAVKYHTDRRGQQLIEQAFLYFADAFSDVEDLRVFE